MKRVIIYCEGASEEKFINGILMPRLAESGVFIRATAFNGVSKYSIIRRELRNLCRSDRSAIENIGLVKIRKRCKHFDAWLKRLENLG